MTDTPELKAVRSYVLRFGGKCRDCADQEGVCPASGIPCDGTKAVNSVLEALTYGFTHGHIDPPAAWNRRPPQDAGMRERVARIVDPGAWTKHDRMLVEARRGVYDDGVPMDQRQADDLASDAAGLLVSSLAKADAILSAIGQGAEPVEADIPEIAERGRRGERLSATERSAWSGYELGFRDGRNASPDAAKATA
jgi:hypothetical protein